MPTHDDLQTRRSQIGQRLREARERAGLTQGQAAKIVGVHKMTISKWELGKSDLLTENAVRLATAYAVPLDSLTADSVVSENVSRDTAYEAWSPNPALRGKIPELAYEAATLYCRRLAAAGVPLEEVEEVERVLIDSRYAKANKREGRPMSESDYVRLVEALWDGISTVLRHEGYAV